MKVFACPAIVPVPTPDYANYDWEVEQKRENDHKKQLASWLKERGYTGKYTGEVVSFSVGDGAANYMVADAPRKFCLIHLPYGDGYNYRHVEFLPKKEIIEKIATDKALNAAFDRAKKGE